MTDNDEVFLGQQVERLTAEALGKTVTIGGREYATRQVFDPRKPEPTPQFIELSTLQSFADFVKDEAGTENIYREPRGLFVHVAHPDEVRLVTGIFGEHHQRTTMATAEPKVEPFQFGQWRDPESFNIALLALFEPAGDRANLFQITGNLHEQGSVKLEDDGVTQRTTVKRGMTLAKEVEVAQTFELAPFRSFPEIEQVASRFVFRLRPGGEGRLPSCALFECDGGRWRLEAIARVKTWLAGELPGVAIYG